MNATEQLIVRLRKKHPELAGFVAHILANGLCPQVPAWGDEQLATVAKKAVFWLRPDHVEVVRDQRQVPPEPFQFVWLIRLKDDVPIPENEFAFILSEDNALIVEALKESRLTPTMQEAFKHLIYRAELSPDEWLPFFRLLAGGALPLVAGSNQRDYDTLFVMVA